MGETQLLHIFGGYDGGKPVAHPGPVDVYTLDVTDPASLESEGSGDDKKKDDKKKDDDEEDA